jgi:hypothetical protein
MSNRGQAKIIHPAGKSAVMSYDLASRPLSAVKGHQGTGTETLGARHLWDLVDGLLESSQTDALGNTNKSRSDAAGNTRISIDAAGNSSSPKFSPT